MNEKEINEKQRIKNQRVKAYFIQAAKEIILTEGAEYVSVRKVADQAGYSFTTIYNYFKDLNELLQDVKNEMIQDVMSHMHTLGSNNICSLDDLKKQNRLYVDYYIEHPHIFGFFYSYRLYPVSKRPADALDFSKFHAESYRGFVVRGVIKETEIPVIAKTIIYTLHGLLAFYFSDNGMSRETLYEELDKTVDYLLKAGN